MYCNLRTKCVTKHSAAKMSLQLCTSLSTWFSFFLSIYFLVLTSVSNILLSTCLRSCPYHSLSRSVLLNTHHHLTNCFLCVKQVTGDRVGKELLYKIGLRDMKTRIQEVARKFHCLQLDSNEYVCLRYLILLNEGT